MNAATGCEFRSFDELCAIALDTQTIRDLRSDHAGEIGAVAIFRGILAVTKDNELRQFAGEQLDTERRHLSFVEQFLPPTEKTRLVLLWQVAGFLTGATRLIRCASGIRYRRSGRAICRRALPGAV